MIMLFQVHWQQQIKRQSSMWYAVLQLTFYVRVKSWSRGKNEQEIWASGNIDNGGQYLYALFCDKCDTLTCHHTHCCTPTPCFALSVISALSRHSW